MALAAALVVGLSMLAGLATRASASEVRASMASGVSARDGVSAAALAAQSPGGAIVPGFTGNTLPANDDGSSGLVPLPFPVNFYGSTYSSLYVNNNGNLTFGQPLSQYTPQSLNQLGIPMIAPFWADVDTRVGPQVTYGYGTVNGHPAFGANWIRVGCYSEIDSVTDTFQVLLVSRPDLGTGRWQIEYNYGPLSWDSGEASGGNGQCLGGSAARAGYTSGYGPSCELPGSGVDGGLLSDNRQTGLSNNDLGSTLPGRFIFDVGNGRPSGCAGYAALGDSYSSGEGTGNFSYSSGCDRGPLAWPQKLSELYSAAPQLNSGSFFACSGETTTELLNGRGNSTEPQGQTTELDTWVSRNGSPSLVTVTIGGNDLGFSSILKHCVIIGAPSCLSQLNKRISYVKSGAFTSILANTYRQIKASAGGSAKVVVVGYPFLFATPSFSHDASADWHCPWLDGDAAQILSRFQDAQNLLDSITPQAAANAGVSFIPLGDLFAGHELCTGDPYINHLVSTSSNAGHPNATGQSVIAQYVGAQLGYLLGNGAGNSTPSRRAATAKEPAKAGTAPSGRVKPAGNATAIPSGQGAAPTGTAHATAGPQTPADSPAVASGLADGDVSVDYTGFLWATGGTAPFTWAVTSGSLPAGLSLDSSTGIISGTPTTAGTSTFTVTATDSGSPAQTTSASESITINPLAPLAVASRTLASPTVGQQYSATLAANGGTYPYTWSVSSGSLPTGLSLDPDSGTISGTPTTAGSGMFTVTATDSSGTPETATATFTLNVAASGSTLTLGTPQLPVGTQGVGYTGALASTGGTGPLYWSVASGGLPDGLSLDAGTGQVTGIPTAAGTFAFTAQVTDSGGNSATKDVSISVAAASVPAIDPVTLSDAMQGQPYSNVVTASGGVAPYTWSVSSGSLPGGLSLDPASGAITGMPTTPGTYPFTVSLADSATPSPQTAAVSLSITVAAAPPPPTMTVSDTVIDGTVGSAYSASLMPANGTGPYSFAVTAGSLPDGLVLDSSLGTITGTPTTPGTYPATIQVTDSSSPTPQVATDDISITVAAPGSLAITTTSMPDASAGTAYALQVAVTGGTGADNFQVTSGSLPDGLTLDPASGIIYGTSATPGSSSFTIMVTDSASPAPGSASASLTLTTDGATAVGIDTTSLPDAAQNVGYSQILAAHGGVTPYTWTVASGSLPAGLSLNPGTGVISGTPTGSGTSTFTVQVTDSLTPAPQASAQSLTLTVNPAASLAITTVALDAATHGSFYSQTLDASGGTSPVTWSVISGSLPDGLALDPGSGTISGTPTGSGTSNFTVEATDNSTPTPQTATQALSIEVVPQAPPPLTPQSISFTAPSSGVVGGSATLSATGGGSGNPVVFTVDSSSGAGICSVSGTNGSTVSYTGAGNCVIDANQAGSASYSTAPQVQQVIPVTKASQSISFTAPASGTVGGSATLSAIGGRSGNPVVFSVDASSGHGVCSVSGTNGATVHYTLAGSCVIDANQAGNANYTAAPQVKKTITVAKAASKTVLSLSTTLVAWGHEKAVTFTVHVTPATGTGIPGGTVTVLAGTKAICTGTLAGGKATCTSVSATLLAPGTYSVSASYPGSGGYLASKSAATTLKVVKEPTKATLATSASSVTYGHEKSLVVTVTVTAQYYGTPAGTVTITAGKITLCKNKALTKGKVTCSPSSGTTLPAGTYTLVATYSGNTDYAASRATKTLKVAKAATAASPAIGPAATDRWAASLVRNFGF